MMKRQQRPPKQGAFVFMICALLAGGGWLGWKQGLFGVIEKKAPPNAANHAVPANTSSVWSDAEGARTNIQVASQLRAPSNEAKVATNVPSSKPDAVLQAQIALDWLGISPGSIDGVMGSQTRAALRAFQRREGLAITGDLDAATRAQLLLPCAPFTSSRIEATDLDRLLPLPPTWVGKSEQPRLDYETILEFVAERTHAHPNLIQRLNPAVHWAAVVPGTTIILPAAGRIRPEAKAAFLLIRLADRTLQAFDATNRLLAHFPCSIAARVDKRPVGELSVTVVVPNPDYLFNPDNFPESAEARELGSKLRLSPGPNNPVGTAWIGLNLSGYGIHGTPKPEDVGRTESHGCFRLANWNAEYLLQLVSVGTRVRIEP